MSRKKLSSEILNTIWKEKEEYINNLRKLSIEEVIDRSYETTWRDCIIDILTTGLFDSDVEKALSAIPNPVGCLYDMWIHTDDDLSDLMFELIEEWCKKG